MMLSHTLIWLNTRTSWNVRVMPSSGVSCGWTTCSPSPSTMTMPLSIGSIPLRMLISVDFPDPFGPMTHVICPRGMEIESRCSACTPPKFLLTPTVPRAYRSASRAGICVIACTSPSAPAAGTA